MLTKNYYKAVAKLSSSYEKYFYLTGRKLPSTTPHYYPKYEVWAIDFFCGRIPLREGVKKNDFLGLCPKLWVGGGPKSQTS